MLEYFWGGLLLSSKSEWTKLIKLKPFLKRLPGEIYICTKFSGQVQFSLTFSGRYQQLLGVNGGPPTVVEMFPYQRLEQFTNYKKCEKKLSLKMSIGRMVGFPASSSGRLTHSRLGWYLSSRSCRLIRLTPQLSRNGFPVLVKRFSN